MPPRKVLPLDVARNVDASMVGAKAMSLFHMLDLGLPVPPGFCITTDAYRDHLDSANLTPKIAAAVTTLEQAEPQKKKDILSEVRQIIIQPPMAETLRRQIEEHYRAFSGKRTAVRSSATAEDLPGQSFAGQYDTYLGVAGLEECIEAVKKCWASLWTERAYDYRQKNAMNHLDVRMAVIVQGMIDADISGITFTADPVTADTEKIVIEAARGLGEDIVRGKVTPDRFVLTKAALEIADRRTAEPDGRLCIDDSAAARLAELAVKVESHFGVPQDIEWSMKHGQVWLLQSRPITTLPPKKSWQDRQIWTNSNAGEAAPDAVTPMTWSLVETMRDHMFASILRLLCVELGENPLAGLIAGRIYFNVNTCVGMLRSLPGGQRINLNKLFGGGQGKMFDLGQLEIHDEDIPDLKFSAVKMILRLPWSMYYILAHSQRKGQTFLGQIRAKNDQLQSLDMSRMSEEELACQLTTAIEDALGSWDVLYPVVAISPLLVLYRICEKWLDDANGTLANSLLAGLGNMATAQAGLDIWRLATIAHESPQVQEVLLSGHSWQTTRAKILAVKGGHRFVQNWDEFMAQHGHHCRGEILLFNARWSETPDYVLGLVRGCTASIGQTDPLENQRRLAHKHQELARQSSQRLRNPIKRCIFNYVLRKAQNGSVLRENYKDEPVRYLAILRKMLQELGRRLNSRAVLADADDIFFLKLEEIEPVRRGQASFNVAEIIVSRRKEYEENKAVTPPKVVIGKFDPDNLVPEVTDTHADTLNGLAVSPGVVTGKARVILRADNDEQVLAGEILVAPFTDPGWTPYFVPAAGIVMDQGGLLSHGSIVAREYGIPAVVNVGPATQIIKTGQTIQVDGDHGTVRILPEDFAADGHVT
jgi:pyruvate,water dikinase